MAHVLCAPDKLRGALDAQGAAAALAEGVRAAGREAVEHPLADGGEGTRDLLARAAGGRLASCPAVDALGRPREAAFALLPDGTAVIECADPIGLALLARDERDPLRTSTAGLAAPLLAAVAAGARRLVVALGGSATCDGGLGLLVALGARAADADGRLLRGTGGELERLAALDLAGVDARVRDVELVGAVDVDAPLTGPRGAARVFAPQKGADAVAVERLEAGLARLAGLAGGAAELPGAGAAGGLGLALLLLGGRLDPGADLVMDATGFDGALAGASLCLTAEGRVDASSAQGKTVARVAARCREAGVPCAVIGGALGDGADLLYGCGASAVLSASQGPGTLDEALAGAAAALAATARAATTLQG